MNRLEHIRLMAQYNEHMNARLLGAAAGMGADEIAADKKGPFGSMLGVLNHLMVADTLWLKRYAKHPARYAALEAVQPMPTPTRLDQILYADLPGLAAQRTALDKIITAWSLEIAEPDLDHVLTFGTIKGVVMRKNFFGLLMHFFNHQTHHRGQATTLLWQADIDIGVTDLMPMLPEA